MIASYPFPDAGSAPRAEDLISAVEFSPSGDYLATGDRGGRVVLFESSEVAQRREGAMAVDPSTSTGDGDGDGSPSAAAAREIEYRFYCEFQSHDPEFDYLKSLEIEERINKIRWCRARTGPLFLLSTNDKTIKLWKVHEKSGRVVTSRNVDPSQPAAAQRAPFLSGPSAVVMPTLQPMQALGARAAAAPSQIPTPFSMHPASWGLFLPSTRAVDDARCGPPVDAPVPDHSQ